MKKVKRLAAVLLLAAALSMSVSAEAAHWYDPYVAWAETNNIAQKGLDPCEKLARGDALRMLKAAETGAFCYTTAEARAWAMDRGISDGERMHDTLTRAEAATLLGRFCGEKDVCKLPFGDADRIPPWAYQFVCAAYLRGTVNGKEDGNFHPEEWLTVAQWETMLYRM